MTIYDPISTALGLEPSEAMSYIYSLEMPKVHTNWNATPWNKGLTYELGPYPKERGEAISRAKKGKPINMRGDKHPRSKPITCVTTGEQFSCGAEVARKYPHIKVQNLCHHLKGRQKHVGGLAFIYST